MKRLLFLSAALLACIGMQSCNDDEIDPNARYNVHTVSNLCEGIYFGDAYLPNDVVYTHYLMISDKPIPESGWMDPEGTYYILRFNAPFENFPPEGTYTTTPVTGRYTGPLKVKDAPKVVEKHDWDLEEDDVLKFDATNFRATAFSDKYTVENALVWKIQLQQYDGNWSYDSDQLIIQIVCALGNEAEPVPGTYRVSEGNEVGTVIAGTYYGTFGIGSFFQHYEAGSIASAGAAVDGSMTLEKNADGTWTIDFDFLDGQAEPKHFSGSWTGTLD